MVAVQKTVQRVKGGHGKKGYKTSISLTGCALFIVSFLEIRNIYILNPKK